MENEDVGQIEQSGGFEGTSSFVCLEATGSGFQVSLDDTDDLTATATEVTGDLTGDLSAPEAGGADTADLDLTADDGPALDEIGRPPPLPPPCMTPEQTLNFERGILGSTLAGCLMDARLGRGAVGSVFLARHLALQKDVAVKILNPALFYLRRHVEQFFREARSAACLEHPGVVAVHDVGQERGLYYLVMQYVEGETVGDLIEREGQIDAREAVRITIETAAALAEAHDAGIVHRDIKPSNLLLDSRNRVKVADFGLALQLSEARQSSGRSEIAGTPFYIPPEQISGGVVDERADLYSLGVTLYFALTGRRPFEGSTPAEILVKHLTESPVPPMELVPTLGEELNGIIMRLLAKKPSGRHRDARELLDDLASLPDESFE